MPRTVTLSTSVAPMRLDKTTSRQMAFWILDR
jgi:hypothetical protein